MYYIVFNEFDVDVAFDRQELKEFLQAGYTLYESTMDPERINALMWECDSKANVFQIA